MKFTLGQLVATPGALAALETACESALKYVKRHVNGDWGIVGKEDAKSNDDAVKVGERILSAYLLSSGVKIWIITEAKDEKGNRLCTTVLLPEEY